MVSSTGPGFPVPSPVAATPPASATAPPISTAMLCPTTTSPPLSFSSITLPSSLPHSLAGTTTFSPEQPLPLPPSGHYHDLLNHIHHLMSPSLSFSPKDVSIILSNSGHPLSAVAPSPPAAATAPPFAAAAVPPPPSTAATASLVFLSNPNPQNILYHLNPNLSLPLSSTAAATRHPSPPHLSTTHPSSPPPTHISTTNPQPPPLLTTKSSLLITTPCRHLPALHHPPVYYLPPSQHL